jgi:DNA-binding NtrC family response regulator
MEAFLSMDFRDAQTAFETRYLLRKLRDHHNNITHTAHSIGILRQSLQQKIKELGLRDLLVDYGSEGRAAEE